MACRLLSATEHHTLQQAGPVARKEKDSRMEEMRRLYVRDLLQQTQKHCENSTRHIAIQTERADFFFETVLPEGYTQYYEKDLSWHKSQSLHRRCGGGGEMNYSTSQCCSALTSCCVLWGGEGSRQQQAAPPHKAAVTWQPQDRASKEPRFSRGQGIISESSSRIIAPSQNDSHRCGTPSQIAGLSLPTHTGWNDSHTLLIARHLSLR